LVVSTLKRRLSELETNEAEEIRQLELEHSLLAAELDAERASLKKVQLDTCRFLSPYLSGACTPWRGYRDAQMWPFVLC
jgi:hypothetical protein